MFVCIRFGALLAIASRAAEDTVPPKELATADDIEDLLSLVELTGTNEPFLPLPYRISEMLGGLHCTLAVLGNVIGRLRGIAPQTAVVDTEHATLSASGHFLVELDGTPFTELWQKSLYTEMPDGSLNTGIFNQLWSQHFRCKDGRAIFLYQKWDPPADLLRMIGFKADEIPALIALTDPKTSTREQRLDFQARLASHIRQTWDAFELEKHIIKTRIGAAMVPRSRSEFLASPQGQAVGRRPPLEFHRTSGFPAVPFTQLRDPSRGILSGIKVVELTRALMGSRIGAILGYFGATVVKATSPFLSDYGVMSAAHNAGKLSVFLDLAKEEDREKLRALIRDADVFVTNYALGALDRLGFGYSQVLDMIKGRDRGIVYCEGNAFGFHGELATAAGFEHLAHALSGLAWGQGVNHAWDKEPEGGHMPAVVPINFIDSGFFRTGLAPIAKLMVESVLLQREPDTLVPSAQLLLFCAGLSREVVSGFSSRLSRAQDYCLSGAFTLGWRLRWVRQDQDKSLN